MVNCTVGGFDVKLDIPCGVFCPTTTTQMLFGNAGNLDGRVVLDLGCGSGPVAIAAALSGARKVYAVDIMEEACEAAARNAELNGVGDRITVLHGNLFEPVKNMKFDVILDDVSGMAEEVSRLSPWYPECIPTGGRDGTDPTLSMLEESQDFLSATGYLLFPVISLSKSEKTVATAQALYRDRLQLLNEKHIPFCKELKENLHVLERLKNEGLISYIQRRSRYFWNLSIYKGTV